MNNYLATLILSLVVGSLSVTWASDKVGSEKDGKDVRENFEALDQTLRDNVHARFADFRVVKVEYKKSPNVIGFFMIDVPYEPLRRFELTLSDGINKEFKVYYAVHGELEETASYKLPFARLPEKISQAVKEWAPDATWDSVAEAKKPHGAKFLYKLKCRLGGKTFKAEVFEDGTFKKSDKLP